MSPLRYAKPERLWLKSHPLRAFALTLTLAVAGISPAVAIDYYGENDYADLLEVAGNIDSERPNDALFDLMMMDGLTPECWDWWAYHMAFTMVVDMAPSANDEGNLALTEFGHWLVDTGRGQELELACIQSEM